MPFPKGHMPVNHHDLTGQKFGRFTVIEYAGKSKWRCICNCGNKRLVMTYALRCGNSTSCGCLKVEKLIARSTGVVKREDLTGYRYGRLVCLEPAPGHAPGNGGALWRCLCDCGNEIIVPAYALKKANTRSCGCLQRDTIKARLTKHGACRSREYRIWRCMRGRCHVEGASGFSEYGARGVYVCSRWRESFASFIADMGFAPSAKHSIDRINNDGSYTCGKCDHCQQHGAPANCRWATQAEQNRNMRTNHLISFNGVTKCLTDWATDIGIHPVSLYYRLTKYNWSVEKALTTPSRRRSKIH